MIDKETLKKAQEWGEPQPPWEDWIIKRYTPDGNVKEATFGGQEEARRAMQLFRDFDMEGHFELVCRPRAEDVVVTSYRNEPEEEPVLHPDYIYTDRDGDEWEHIDGRWITGDTHAERVTAREDSPGRASLPETFGPYQRDRLVPETTEQDDEPEFDPAYTYRDKDGDKWEFSTVEKAWVCYYHVTGDIQMIRPRPLAEYGPYTRIEDTNG